MDGGEIRSRFDSCRWCFWWIMERVSVLVDPATAEVLRQIAKEQGIRPRGPGPLAATVRWLVAQYRGEGKRQTPTEGA